MKKFSDTLDNEAFNNKNFITLKTSVKILQKKISDATTLTHINEYNTEKQNLEKKIGDIDKKVIKYQMQVV